MLQFQKTAKRGHTKITPYDHLKQAIQFDELVHCILFFIVLWLYSQLMEGVPFFYIRMLTVDEALKRIPYSLH